MFLEYVRMKITSGGYSETLSRKNRTIISALSNGEIFPDGSHIVQCRNLSYSACTRNTHTHCGTPTLYVHGIWTSYRQGPAEHGSAHLTHARTHARTHAHTRTHTQTHHTPHTPHATHHTPHTTHSLLFGSKLYSYILTQRSTCTIIR